MDYVGDGTGSDFPWGPHSKSGITASLATGAYETCDVSLRQVE